MTTKDNAVSSANMAKLKVTSFVAIALVIKYGFWSYMYNSVIHPEK